MQDRRFGNCRSLSIHFARVAERTARRALERDRPYHRPVHTNRMPKLLHRRGMRCNMIGECSKIKTPGGDGQTSIRPQL
jgi:hypothetical protein